MQQLRHCTRIALRLMLILVASASCTADEMVQPSIEPAFSHDATAARTSAQHVKVRALADGHTIRGSNAVLFRKSAGLIVKVKTRELAPFESVDVFWAVFNNAAACAHHNPLTGAPCSPPDLFVAETKASLHYIATLSADRHGMLSYSAALDVRSTAGCVADPFPCNLLTNPFGAEVHSAMFVRNGGPGRQAAQFVSPPAHLRINVPVPNSRSY